MVEPPYGERGHLELDADNDQLQCHVCGRWYRNLAQHARLAHGLSAAEYRELAGLNRQTRLQSPGLRALHQERQGPRLRQLHAEGKLPRWDTDPDQWHAAKSAAVDALREGLSDEARQHRRASWDDERRREAAERRRARNLAGHDRADPAAIQAGVRRGTVVCQRCGQETPRLSPRQYLCPTCRVEHDREYQRAWKQRKRTAE